MEIDVPRLYLFAVKTNMIMVETVTVGGVDGWHFLDFPTRKTRFVTYEDVERALCQDISKPKS